VRCFDQAYLINDFPALTAMTPGAFHPPLRCEHTHMPLPGWRISRRRLGRAMRSCLHGRQQGPVTGRAGLPGDPT